MRRDAPRSLEPFTLDHFRAYARKLILDNGEPWEPEDFQLAFVEDLFADFSEDWLVVPEGNGKTTLLAGVALYHGDYTPDAMVPIGASSRDQCEVLHNQAAGFVRRSPGLERRFRVFDGYRRITCLRSGGRIQVFAADDRTGDGVIPTLCLLDELHRHRDLRLYRTWRGKLEKRQGKLAAISTAGEPGGEFEEIRSLHRENAIEVERDGAHVRAAGGGMVLHDWAIADPEAIEDFAAVKAANPLSQITVASLAAKRESPSMSNLHWRRFVCNLPTSVAGEGISAVEWDALREDEIETSADAPAYGFIDLGWKIDCTALGVLVWEGRERRVVTGVRILTPPVDESDIVAALVEINRAYRLEGIVFDPNAGGRQMVQMLEKGEHPRQQGVEFAPFIEHSQDAAPMTLAAERLDEAIRTGWLVHDGNLELRQHVLNAVRKSTGPEKHRYDRPPAAKGEQRRKYPIDALTGLLMGHSIAVAEQEAPVSRVPLIGVSAR